jgi:Domain of unknown function (DUF6438)
MAFPQLLLRVCWVAVMSANVALTTAAAQETFVTGDKLVGPNGKQVYPIPHDDTVISLHRGNCEIQECPVYRVLIFGDGDVIWQGRARVAKRGVALSWIEHDQILTLIQDFESIDFFHLENIYGFRGSGCQSTTPAMPMAVISLSMAGLSKIIQHHDGCVGEVSRKLAALEGSIDQAVNVARWITGKPRKKR